MEPGVTTSKYATGEGTENHVSVKICNFIPAIKGKVTDHY
jgi:calcium-dependent protein kinase